MHKNDLKCIFGCSDYEDQTHIFTQCPKIKSQLNITENTNLDHIYCEVEKQIEAAQVLIQIDKVRRQLKDKLLPGSATVTVSQDPCTLNAVQQITSL